MRRTNLHISVRKLAVWYCMLAVPCLDGLLRTCFIQGYTTLNEPTAWWAVSPTWSNEFSKIGYYVPRLLQYCEERFMYTCKRFAYSQTLLCIKHVFPTYIFWGTLCITCEQQRRGSACDSAQCDARNRVLYLNLAPLMAQRAHGYSFRSS